ncbi:hypothetical protein [Mesorhizobium sophorae]|uniref:hypothetical protein n=1 Tax=Mesorhizobium sophorae TaxID=1300294 RepID=UPI000BA48E1D|nr:hypothetical protein [Mesorhizobium sophorae]
MLKLLIRLGAIYAAFQIGREYGRAETEVMLLPPVDYERRPSGKERGGVWGADLSAVPTRSTVSNLPEARFVANQRNDFWGSIGFALGACSRF